MYAGAVKRPDGSMGPGWLDYPTFEVAGQEGALFLRQDVRQLDALIRLGVDGFFRLVDEGRLVAPEIDHVVCHYSSQFFRTRIFELLAKAGAPLPRGEVVLEPHHARKRRLRVGVRAAGRTGEQRPRPPGPAGLRHGPRERPVHRQLHEAHGRR